MALFFSAIFLFQCLQLRKSLLPLHSLKKRFRVRSALFFVGFGLFLPPKFQLEILF